MRCGYWQHSAALTATSLAASPSTGKDRFSDDIDIFHDSTDRQHSAVAADEAVLTSPGYALAWPPIQRTGKHQATIAKCGDQMLLEWLTDSAFRFFPHSPTRCSVTCCIQPVLRPTRPLPQRTDVSGEMLLIW
jgi:hypothetical protein